MMKVLCDIDEEKIEIKEFPIPEIIEERDVIVEITYDLLCITDIHIVKGKVPRVKKGIILGQEGLGIVNKIKKLKICDHVSINCIIFSGNYYFCKKGFIKNCAWDGWEISCRINATPAKYVWIPLAEYSLNKITNEKNENSNDKDYLFVGDALTSSYFGINLGEIKKDDIFGVIGCGPVGLCSLICGKMKGREINSFWYWR